jgi:hypothetical protein
MNKQQKMQLKVTFLLLLISTLGFAQNTITGEVYENNKPSTYIEVVLYDATSKPLTSTFTDDKGKFSLQAQKGNHKVEGRLLGKILFTKEVMVEKNVDLGRMEIQTTQELTEVVIESRKKLIERKVDRLVFNVENSIAVTGGNALDALKITPRIKVQNDQISMIGKGGMMFMVNDRPLQLSGDDLSNFLKTLNAEDIKKIEVITNPPAKFSAEGNSGIINIVTKSAKNESWNVSYRNTYQQATFATGNTGGSFNLQKGNIEFTSNISYTNGSNAPDETSKIYYPKSTWDIANNRRDYSNNLSTRLGLNYKINDKLKTGFNINLVNSKPIIKDNEKTNIFNTSNIILDSIIATKARSVNEKKLISLNYFAIYEIDTLGKKLSLDVDYFDYKNITSRIFRTQSYFSENQPKPINPIEARNIGNQKINNYSINLDMEHPLKLINLNYGGRISQIKTNNIFNFFEIINQNEILDLDQSNVFEYQENIQAAYFSGQKNFNKKWEVKIGLRYEWTQTKGFSQTNNQTNTNNYQKLFPTFYLAYTPNDNHSFSLKYGKRIQRPSYNFLNPFRYLSNPFSYSEGNPFLQPAFINNIELEYGYKDNLTTNIYFSHTDSGFEQATLLDSTTNIQQIIPLNFITNKTVGINQTFIYKLKKWWNINFSLDISYSNTNSKITQTLQFLSGWNGNFSFNNDFLLNNTKTLLASINYNYTTSGVSNLDYNSSANQLNASIKWLLLNKNLTISLYTNDILSSNRFTYSTFSNGIENTFRNYYDERFFRIGVIYNYGKKFNINNRINKNQEEQNRTN